jgi:hypothetical protein
MKLIHSIALLLVVGFAVAGCRSSAEFFGFVGTPASDDGWSHDYNSTANDTWEAIRRVVKDNGEITWEDPVNMKLEGLYHNATEGEPLNMKAAVYDKSSPEELRSRLIVHCWYARLAHDRGRPDDAREFCNVVYRLLKEARGEGVDEDPEVTTTSEKAVEPDEAIGFFKVSREQAFATCEAVMKEFGDVAQAEPEKGYLRGKKVNALEKQSQEVVINVYDRTEGKDVRVKVSVKVRGAEDKPMQEIAKAYVGQIHERLEKQFGAQE